jgi:hypothetical protein
MKAETEKDRDHADPRHVVRRAEHCGEPGRLECDDIDDLSQIMPLF